MSNKQGSIIMAMMVMENQQPAVQMHLIPAASRPPLPPPPPAPQAYKHHCKVCKKGFVCGRALGGHMRAHGIGDDGLSAEGTLDDDSAPYGGGAGESSETGSPSTTTKRMYALRTNPGRLRNCRICENCGKEFTSWKSLLDHGRCDFDEDDDLDSSLCSSPLHDADDGEEEEEEDLALAAGWYKGKRSRRAKVMAIGSGSISELHLPTPSSEEEDLANCLVMLSSSHAAQAVVVDADQVSCASASKDKAERNRLLVPQPISMVAPAAAQMIVLAPQVVDPQHVPTVPRGMFECKACKKVFTSHQALGGHRASHKKVKGCFAAKLESNRSETHQQPVSAAPHDNTKAIADTNTDANIISVNANVDGKTTDVGAVEVVMATAAPEMAVMAVDEVAPVPYAVSPFKKKGKVHECSVCHRVFTSGQALGGHKRCHWLTSSATSDPAGAVAKLQPVAPDHVMAAMCHQLTLGCPMFDTTAQRILDLNVPTNPLADQAVATRQAAELNDSPLCLNAPASVYMQSWTGHSSASHVNKTPTRSLNDSAVGGGAATEDEADSTSAKRAKISDLKDMNVAGESLPWLQVGIGNSSSESKEKNTQG